MNLWLVRTSSEGTATPTTFMFNDWQDLQCFMGSLIENSYAFDTVEVRRAETPPPVKKRRGRKPGRPKKVKSSG